MCNWVGGALWPVSSGAAIVLYSTSFFPHIPVPVPHPLHPQATTREQSWCCGCVAMCAHHSHPARNKSVPPQSVSLLLGGAACIPKNATLACPSGALILATVPVRGLTRNKHHVQPRSPRKQPEEGQNPQMGSLQSAPDLSGCHAPASVCIVYISWELMPLGKDSVNPR